MAPTTHTETHPLVFGQEVSFGSIAGPTDFIDVFVDANAAKNAIVEWRVYATVGSLVSQVGTGQSNGNVASVLKWSGLQGPYSPLAANGSLYELRAYWAQPGSVPTLKASIVGYDEFDTVADSDASASEQIPASFAEVEFATANGYSQFADVAVTQQFTGNVNFTLYALAGAGGVEAAVASQPLQNPNDSTTRIFSNLKLPGATSYSLRANNISTTGIGPTIAASLACYSTDVTGSTTVVQLTPAPDQVGVIGPSDSNQIDPVGTTSQALFANLPGPSTQWTSPGYFNVLSFGAKGDGTADDSVAFTAALTAANNVGGSVLVPATSNHYRIGSDITLPSGVAIVGENSQTSDISNGGSFLFFDIGASLLLPDSSSGSRIRSLIFKSQNAGVGSTPLIVFGDDISFISFEDCHFYADGAHSCIQMGSSGTPIEADPVSFTDCNFFAGANQSVPIVQGYGVGGGFNNISFERCQFTGGTTITAELVHFEETDDNLLTNVNFSRCLFEVPVAGAVVFASVQRSGFYNTWAGDLGSTPNTGPLFKLKKSAASGALVTSEIVFNIMQTDIGSATAGLETINADATSLNVVCIACIIESINNGGPGGNPITCINCNVTNVAGDPVTQINSHGAVETLDVQVDTASSPTVLIARLAEYAPGSQLGAIWFQPYAATKDGNNYTILQSSALLTRFNGPTGGAASFRVGDTEYMRIDQANSLLSFKSLPFLFNPGTSSAPAAPAAGFVFYVDATTGALSVRGSSGTITALALP